MAAPCALVASCSEKEPADLVRGILGTNELPESTPVIEDIFAYPWKVETKYYTADIRVCSGRNRTIGDASFADSVHAFIVHFDSNDAESFSRVKMWLPFLKEIMPEVQLLVCERCDGSKGLSKEDAWNWCLENAFELVELDPVMEDNGDDDDFAETLGMKRIIQALHAHTWPNLVMKDESTFRSPYMNKMMQEEVHLKLENEKNAGLTNSTDGASVELDANEPIAPKDTNETNDTNDKNTSDNSQNIQETDEVATATASALPSPPSDTPTPDTKTQDKPQDTKAQSTDSKTPALNPDDLSLAALGLDDADALENDEFLQLFENLADMKNKAMTLPMDQRKEYAEKVAIGFWRAMCGDEEEIAGLSDDD